MSSRWAVGGVLIAAGVALGIFISGTHLTAGWFLVGLSVGIALLPFALAVLRRRFDIFEPVYLFSASYAVLFVIRPVFDLIQSDGPRPLLGYAPSGTYVATLTVGLLGALGFMLGYYLPAGRELAKRIPLPTRPWLNSSLYAFVFLALVGSFIVYGVFITTGGGRSLISAILSGRNAAEYAAVAASSGYLYTAPLWLTPLSMLLLALSPRWTSARALIAFGILVYAQLSSLAAGDRSWTLPALASLFLLFYLRRGRRPKFITVSLVVVAVFLFGITVPREYRNTLNRNTSLPELALSVAVEPVKSIVAFFGSGDTAMVDNLAIELQFVPGTLPFQNGQTYVEALTRPVPRAVWSAKPIAADTLLMQTIWPDFDRQHVGFSFSLFGEPYLNFGAPGVLVITLLLGIAWRSLYSWFQRHQSNPTIFTLFALNWPFLFVYMRGGIGVDYQREVLSVALLLLAIPFAQLRFKKETLQLSSRERIGIASDDIPLTKAAWEVQSD